MMAHEEHTIFSKLNYRQEVGKGSRILCEMGRAPRRMAPKARRQHLSWSKKALGRCQAHAVVPNCAMQVPGTRWAAECEV